MTTTPSATTTTSTLDQLMLPGQTAAPPGPADMTMMYVMHHAFRRDLHRFVAAVEATPAEDRATWQALADRWGRFATILHHHHTVEDQYIWPFLMQRADATERETLEAMEDEHEHIDPLLTSVADGFEALADDRLRIGAEELRAALEERVVSAREMLARHLEHEETGAIVILQRHSTTADWHRIEKDEIGKQKIPVPVPFLVGWCAEGIPAKERNEIFALTGRGFQLLWLLTRRGFRRGEARAFKYAA